MDHGDLHAVVEQAVGRLEPEQAAADYDRMKEKVLAELKNTFRPEFLNRIDATVVFRSLTREEIREIVDFLLKRVKGQLAGQEMELQITDAAKDAIIARRSKEAKNIAKVAAARRLLTLVFYGMRDGQIRCLSQPPATQTAQAA